MAIQVGRRKFDADALITVGDAPVPDKRKEEEEEVWSTIVEIFCRTLPVWGLLHLPVHRFGASRLFSRKAGQEKNSPQ
jgi:hypothetical protein